MLGRRFASSSAAVKTQFSTLKNGLTVATESNPFAKTSSIGLYLEAGSRAENPYNSGVSSLTTKVLASPLRLKGIENGVYISTINSKEISGITTEFANGNNKAAVELLKQVLKSSQESFNNTSLVANEAKLAGKLAETIEATPRVTVLEHLNSTAFQGTPLALPTYGKADTVSTLESMDLEAFYKKNFVASNIAIVGTGDINHDELVSLAENLELSSGTKPESKNSSFLGSEVRFRDDTLPKAYIAIAAQGESLDSPNYWVAKIASEVNGEYNAHSIFSNFLGSKLSHIIRENHLADTYSHFSTSYTDNGLWGFYTETDNVGNIDDLIHFTLKDWNRLSTSITAGEIERAKSALKLKVLSVSESPLLQANKLAGDVLLSGFKPSSEEVVSRINAITVSDVMKWAQTALWDKDIAISGTGQIEGLYDYNRLRNDMAALRW